MIHDIYIDIGMSIHTDLTEIRGDEVTSRGGDVRSRGGEVRSCRTPPRDTGVATSLTTASSHETSLSICPGKSSPSERETGPIGRNQRDLVHGEKSNRSFCEAAIFSILFAAAMRNDTSFDDWSDLQRLGSDRRQVCAGADF